MKLCAVDEMVLLRVKLFPEVEGLVRLHVKLFSEEEWFRLRVKLFPEAEELVPLHVISYLEADIWYVCILSGY